VSASAIAAQREESRGETPWVPTPEEVVDTMLRLAKVTAADTVPDLGCDDGRIVVATARDFGARAALAWTLSPFGLKRRTPRRRKRA